jgi:single stranded DNA-binding protein
MMAADNRTAIAGNLVETPELRFTNTGTPVTNLRVAVTQGIQQDGEWRDGETSFFKVNVWRGQAEHLADSLAKGDRIMVTGRLRQSPQDPGLAMGVSPSSVACARMRHSTGGCACRRVTRWGWPS